MDISRLYWAIFLFVFSFASSLIFAGYQNIGIVILLILGFSHLIIFHIAENAFMSTRLKIKERIDLIKEVIIMIWKTKSIIIMLVFYAITIGLVIVIAICNIFLKKSLHHRNRTTKTFQ